MLNLFSFSSRKEKVETASKVLPIDKQLKKQERAELYKLATEIFFKTIKDKFEIQMVFEKKDKKTIDGALEKLKTHKCILTYTTYALFNSTVDNIRPALIFLAEKKVKIQLENWLKDNQAQTKQRKNAFNEEQLMLQYRYIRQASEVKSISSTKKPSEEIFQAANLGDTVRLKILINKGENPFFIGDFKQTALHRAAEYGYNACVEILLEAHPTLLNLLDGNGESAVHSAAANDNVKTLETLQNYGANIYLKNIWGATPLHRAVSYGHEKAALWLINQGANLIEKDKKGQTATQIAKDKKYIKLAEKLEKLEKERGEFWLDSSDKNALQQEILNKMKLHDTDAVLSSRIEVKSGDNTFLILKTINLEEANALYKQERIRISFKEAEKTAPANLGKGHYGKVGLAKYINSEGRILYVGVKKVKNEKIQSSEEEDRHHFYLKGLPNIIPFYGSVMHSNARYQFMALGGLGNGQTLATMVSTLALKKEEFQTYSVYVTQNVLTGLAAMHDVHAFHLDKKPQNLVFSGYGDVFIIDFGCMILLKPDEPTLMKVFKKGDIRYISFHRFLLRYSMHHKKPLPKGFDLTKEDSWMAGVTLLEMMKNFTTKDNPDGCWIVDTEILDVLNSPDDPRKFFEEKLDSVEELKSPEKGSVWELISQLLTLDEDKRLTCKEGLYHPALQNQAWQFKSKEDRMLFFGDLQNRYEEHQEKLRKKNWRIYNLV